MQMAYRVEQLAAEKGLTIPQIATAYVMSQPLNIFALAAEELGAGADAPGAR